MRNFKTHIVAAILALSILASCSKDEAIAEFKTIEKTNFKFTGDINFFDVQEGGDFDLVKTTLNNGNTNDITFTIALSNGHELSLRLYNQYATNVWESISNFPIYTTADMPEHWKFSVASYKLSSDAAGYETHLGNRAPTVMDISPVKITSYNADTKEVKIQFEDMTLFKNIDTNKTVTLNGTFVSHIDIN